MSETIKKSKKSAPKRSSVWLLLFLTIITFGYYGIYWAIVTERQLNPSKSPKSPSWLWLLLPGILVPVVMTTLAVGLVIAYFSTDLSVDFLVDSANGLSLIQALALFCFTLPWIIPFIRLVAKNTGLKIWWLVIAYFIAGPLVAIPIQYRLNKAPKKLGLPWISSVIFIALTVSAVLFTVFTAADTKSSYVELKEAFRVNNTLMEEYYDCSNQLEADFPGDLTDENYSAYNKAQINCERKYQKWVNAWEDN